MDRLLQQSIEAHMISSDLMHREEELATESSIFMIAEALLPMLSFGRNFEKEKEAEVIEPIKGTLTVSF